MNENSVPVMSTPLVFPQWRAVLRQSDAPAAEFEVHIFDFLRFCRAHHAAATVGLARHFLSQTAPALSEGRRAALRWLFRAGRRKQADPGAHVGGKPGAVRVSSGTPPPPAATDLGGADWERDLIAALRRKGMLWRTEQAYRQWAARFAAHLRPRSPYSANGDDVAAFLSKLAVEARASAATQKQALNALVFLLEEGLRRTVGKIDFKRAWARRRIPTVLTRGECDRLFAELTGYGAASELLTTGDGLLTIDH